MKSAYLLRGLLLLSGLLAIAIGGSILFNPIGFHASSGLSLPADTNLLSELRAPGGALLSSGLIIGLGAWFRSLEVTAILLSALVYLSYGLSRIFSMYVDGMPAENLLIATFVELAIGALCVICLSLRRRDQVYEH